MAEKEVYMKYKMQIHITDPETGNGTYRELTADVNKGGNGYWMRLIVDDRKVSHTIFPAIQKDKIYDPEKADGWLYSWAQNYWSGENGAWKLDGILIEKAEG